MLKRFMMGRSLSCSPEGIQKAKRALIRCSLTQKALAEKLEVTRQPIGKFFRGKPVDRNIFVKICGELSLDWEEVIPKPTIAALVQEVREKIKPRIQELCGTMRVLDMTQPIGLNDIYTSVNILEKITGRQRLGIDELLQQCKSQDFELFGLNRISEKRVPGIEAVEKYSKLMILGKPGAGKTTFLKYLAIQCIGGEFQAERVPIFVTLKNFAEAANKPRLLEYIIEESINPISSIRDVITYGKALVLLDGLDEVREEDSDRILKEIREFSDRFPKNQFVMTCRIAAREYTFEKFTEVEFADFDEKQISNFANNWFKKKTVKSDIFINRLENNNRIKELATSPLLLTLLCLAFEESGDFPANRSELYKEGIDALLKKWDVKRGIERDRVYKKLSIQRKEDLLSKMALITFEGSKYFFEQREAEQYITEYIRNLRNANTEEEALQLDSEKVLKSIETQHGLIVERAKKIYSFCHLTIHEYFTAREIVVVKHSSDEALQSLVKQITNKRWREIFLLAVGMSPNADQLLLLMKEKIDNLVANNKKLQDLLTWIYNKAATVRVPYKSVVVRAFYLERLIDLHLATIDIRLAIFFAPDDAKNEDFGIDAAFNAVLIHTLETKLYSNTPLYKEYNDFGSNLDLVLEPQLAKYLNLNLTISPQSLHEVAENCFNFVRKLYQPLENILKHQIKLELKVAVQELKDELPEKCTGNEIFKKWWQENGKDWTTRLRNLMIEYRKIGHDWQFTSQELETLKSYYNTNKLLVNCLNSDCYVSREVRQQIEDTLLLPIAEIKQHQQQS
ncbi:MAG: NACHT domain-containing NTPase [Nostoc sp.]|uniref:NACHT domain-containing NTPase n=1 Tax=Nostoc sp. TaxID=1180 RepID=UPI002FEEED97